MTYDLGTARLEAEIGSWRSVRVQEKDKECILSADRGVCAIVPRGLLCQQCVCVVTGVWQIKHESTVTEVNTCCQ
jgi:hypothetical protein